MGGIAGVYYPATPKPVDPIRIAAMIGAMRHRGPDDDGIWTAPGVGLGHRRLAVIDVVGSVQPMNSGALTVSFDGEIYNFAELRAELEDKGARFTTAGDTEVLLHGWRAWGPDLLDKLNGMFAFALHDAERGCLLLARDRFGVKPLHYVELSDGGLAFASELKGLLAHPLLRREVSPTAIEDYMALGYVPDDACIVAGVRKLAAGHFLLVERGRPVRPARRWWDIDFSNRARGSVRDLGAELAELMRVAVRSRMVADVPLGALLSGGIDSSAVVAMMAEASPRAVKTYTTDPAEGSHDASEHAAAVARRFATDHSRCVAGGDDLTLIETIVAAFDEPFADASALAIYRLCEHASASVTVALSGGGADEALAGYRRHCDHRAWERVRGLVPIGVRSPTFGRFGVVYRRAEWAPGMSRAKTALTALGGDGADAYALAVGVTTPEVRLELYSDTFRRAIGGYRGDARIAATMRDAPGRDGLDAAQYADFKHSLPGSVLAKLDRSSMAVGLEAREPLLDHRLVEFEATLPPSMRVRGGQGKWLMKRALEPWLPKDLLYRPEKCPLAPGGAWFRGALADEAAMLAKSPVLATWFDRNAVARLAEDHRSGRAEHGRTLWQLLMLEKAMARLFG